jgi:glutamine amidotransferase
MCAANCPETEVPAASNTVAVVDYGSGNLRSAAKALERAAAALADGTAVTVTADPDAVAAADRIVLPGVGAFADCMSGLRGVPGMIDALRQAVLAEGRPFLGICVGMQLLATTGREHGAHAGLGWLPGEVLPLHPDGAEIRVPHMGWNELRPARAHPVLEGLADGAHVYFVHGYYFAPAAADTVLAEVEYGTRFAAVVGRDNIVGTQFHPEKSQAAGLRLLGNFLRWRP